MKTPAATVSKPMPPGLFHCGRDLGRASMVQVAMGFRWTSLAVIAAWAAWAGPAALCADEADDQYAVAAGHYARQQWQLADEEFRRYFAKFPDHAARPAALFYHGETLLQLGRFDEAAARCGEYLQQNPSGEFAKTARFRVGEAEYLAGKLDQAKADLAQFLEKHPADPLNAYVLPYLGEIALANHELAAAESFFRRGLSEYPEGRLQDDCRYGLARTLEKQEQHDEAEKLYLAVAGKPGSRLAADAQYRLGAVQYAMGRYAEAVETFRAFETTWAASPRQAPARLGRGWALIKLGKPADAAACFSLIVADPKHGIEARYWLGLSQKAQNDWSGAAKTLLAAAEAAPDHAMAPALRFHAGDALLRGGDPAAAVRQFDLALSFPAPGNPWLDHALRGKVQAAAQMQNHGEIDRLAEEFRRRFPASPLKADVDRMAARSLIERKEYQAAARCLEPLAAADSGMEDRYLLAVCLEGLKRYDDALRTLAPVLASPDSPLRAEARWLEASIHAVTGRYREAIAPLEDWIATAQHAPADAAVKGRGLLAICYVRTGQFDKAKRLAEELTGKYAGHALFGPAIEQLAEAAYEAGQTEWSNELFQRLAGHASSAAERLKALSGLGWSLWKAGRLDEAAATFERLLEQHPDPDLAAETALARGQILEKLKRPDDALAMYDRVIAQHATSKEMPQALLGAARLHKQAGRHQVAAALLERLVREHPKLPELDAVLYEWAWTLADMGKQAESIDKFERIRKGHPKSRYWADSAFRVAQAAYRARQFAQARDVVDKLLAANPDPAVREHAMYLKGQIAAGQQKWPEAAERFAAVVREFPRGTLRRMAEYGQAEAAFQQGDYTAAAERFARLGRDDAQAEPSWRAVVRLRQAQALGQQKKWKEAHAVASTIEAAFPGFEEQYEADYLVGRCLASWSTPDFEGARAAYRKVIRSPGGAKSETAAKAQLMIAETYFHEKDYAAALREYLRVEILYAYPEVQAAALLQAGKCHELLGETKQAAEVYARLASTWPDSPPAKEAVQRAKALRQDRKP